MNFETAPLRLLLLLVAAMLPLAASASGSPSGSGERAATTRTDAQGAAALTRELAALAGTFSRADVRRGWVYSDRTGLDRAVARHPVARAVEVLVGCLKDTTPTRSTFDGRPVALGVVCREALAVTVYHEPAGADGDTPAGRWAGDVAPDATPDALAAAQQAWRKVLRDKTYVVQ